MSSRKKYFFASDFHLGLSAKTVSEDRERKIIRWLTSIQSEAKSIFLVGDLFDFWFEYKTTVPKGYVRFLGKLAELKDAGIDIFIFTGNHDLWMRDYFPKELNIPVYHKPIIKEIEGKKFMIGHGDGLGPKDKGYKILKKVFTNPFCKWAFRQIHPDFGIRLANYFSKKSRYAQKPEEHKLKNLEDEWLYLYAREKAKNTDINYFVFGHRHLPLDIEIKKDCRYLNLGDWLDYFTYAVYDGKKMEIKIFENEHDSFPVYVHTLAGKS